MISSIAGFDSGIDAAIEGQGRILSHDCRVIATVLCSFASESMRFALRNQPAEMLHGIGRWLSVMQGVSFIWVFLAVRS